MTRMTPQRSAILRVLEEALGPLTPHEVLTRAVRKHCGLGLATVYRTLSSFEAAGRVVAVHLPGESTRFELAGEGHHHHFRCEQCDEVFELPTACPVAMLEGALLPGGFQIRGHELMFYGLCPRCQTNG